MRIGALQFDVLRGDVGANLSEVEEGMQQAAAQGLELLLLPEMWSTSFLAEVELEDRVRESELALERVASLSKELGLAVAGSSYAKNPGGLPFNRMRLFDRGEQLLSYDKVHLFSPTAEQQAFASGAAAPPTVEWRGWKLSAVVCYDLRFASLLRRPFEEQAELLLVSAQWPVERAAHWQALLQGRAVEHQAFFLGANRTGMDQVGRRQLQLHFPGNSMLVSPEGQVLAQGDGRAGLVIGELDKGAIRQLRRGLPVRKDERLL